MAQQDDGNLARLTDYTAGYNSNTINFPYLDGYLIETTKYTGKYNQRAAFNLTTFDITESLWGKKVRVTADVTTSQENVSAMFRVGMVTTNGAWVDHKSVNIQQNGKVELEYEKDSRSSNAKSDVPLMLLINTQIVESSPLNTITITNVRLEVIE